MKRGKQMKRLSMVFAAACMATTLATAVPMNVFAAEATQEAKPEEVKESSQTEDTSATQKLSVTYKTKKYVKKVNIKMGNKTVKKTAVKSTFLYPVIANTDPAAKKIQAYFQKEYKNWKKAYKDDVQMICGDMPVLRVEDDHTITVHPSPWNGKERIKGHISAPLGGIIILEQSDIDEISQMKKDESAIPLLLQLALKPETEQDVKNMSMIENVILDHYPVWKMKNRGDVNSVYLAAETFERMIMEAKRL
jgi:hypothetical protein